MEDTEAMVVTEEDTVDTEADMVVMAAMAVMVIVTEVMNMVTVMEDMDTVIITMVAMEDTATNMDMAIMEVKPKNVLDNVSSKFKLIGI